MKTLFLVLFVCLFVLFCYSYLFIIWVTRQTNCPKLCFEWASLPQSFKKFKAQEFAPKPFAQLSFVNIWKIIRAGVEYFSPCCPALELSSNNCLAIVWVVWHSPKLFTLFAKVNKFTSSLRNYPRTGNARTCNHSLFQERRQHM